MAYFQNKTEETHQPLFHVPLQEDDPDDEDELQDWQNDPVLQPGQETEQTGGRFLLSSGVGDFIGILAGMIFILLLITMLISLMNWLIADVDQFLTLWNHT